MSESQRAEAFPPMAVTQADDVRASRNRGIGHCAIRPLLLCFCTCVSFLLCAHAEIRNTRIIRLSLAALDVTQVRDDPPSPGSKYGLGYQQV